MALMPTPPAPNTMTGYQVVIQQSLTVFNKYTAGVQSAPTGGNGSVATAWAIGDVCGFERVGTSLLAYRNGSLITSTTDAAFTSGRGAIEMYPTSTNDDITFTTFVFGNFTAAGGLGWTLTGARARLAGRGGLAG